LVPIDNRLVAFELVDGKLSASDLIAQALANGPGIREMEGLLSLIHESNERAKGPGKYLPVFESRMIEGGFGTGPGDRMDWENRWDFGLQARWNLTELLTARDRQRILQAKTDQAHLIYQDLRGKLAAGVQEAREAILSGRDQIRLGEEQIQQAQQAYKLSDERLKNNITGSSSSEVLLSLQAVGAAQASYVNAIRSYDKAQLRLMVLLGAAGSNDPSDGNCPKRCGKSQ
jgi:outer membrane protein TolC